MRPLLSFCCCAVLCTAGMAHHPTVHTSRKGTKLLPLTKEKDVFHFIIFGDRTGGPAEGIKVLKQAVKDTNLLDPDLVMTVGDLVQGYNTTPKWLEEMKEFKGVMGKLKMPWFPVAGNHDIYWRGKGKPPGEHEKSYETHFGPLWYWFKHKNAGFVVLYTDEGNLKTGEKGYNKPELLQMSNEQLQWLEKSLKDMKSLDHVFVFLHHPRWVEQWYKGSNWSKVHEILVKAGNVKSVFAGHIHRMRYDGKKDGIEYFALATTGGAIPGTYPGVGYLHHMNVVTVRKDSFSVAGIPVGTVIDPRQFTALRQKDIDLLRNMRPLRQSQRVELGVNGDAAGYYQVTVTNPASKAIEMAIAPTTKGNKWLFLPDHRHLKLGPGEKQTVEFGYARKTGFAPFYPPQLAMEIDYLEKGSRIRVPPRAVAMDLTLRKLPEGYLVNRKNGALHLNGKGSLRVNDLQIPQGAFTVEAWAYPTKHSDSQAVVAKTEQSEFSIFLNKGKPRFDVFLGNSYVVVTGGEALPLNQWHHLAGVFDGEEVRLYVNGKKVAAKKGSRNRKTNRLPLYVGADPDSNGNPTRFFIGRLDEIHLSKGSRYDADFTPLQRAKREDSTLLLLHCDQFIGPFAVDVSTVPHHSLRQGATQIVPGPGR